MDKALENALIGLVRSTCKLVDAVGKALEEHAFPRRSFSTTDSGALIRVRQIDTLDFDGSIEPVEAERLIRIIANASHNSARLAEYVRQRVYGDNPLLQNRPPNKPVSGPAAMRYAATLRDSLSSLMKIIGADEFKLRTPDWLDPYEEEKDAVTTDLDPLDRAFIYQKVKRLKEEIVRQHVVSHSIIADRLDDIMEELKNGNETNH